jgi:hypothetical protein
MARKPDMRKSDWRQLAAVLRFLRAIRDTSHAVARRRRRSMNERFWWLGRVDGIGAAIRRIERAIDRAKGKP